MDAAVITWLEGPDNAGRLKVEHPTWEDVESAIRSLDAAGNGLVVLTPDTGYPFMAVSGGITSSGTEQFVTCVTHGDFTNFWLCNGTDDDEVVYVNKSGNLEDVPKYRVCGLMQTLNVAREFFVKGETTRNSVWEEDRQ